ncbi:MAG: transcriptional repressor LexA [bacterium]|nr:transcriptional repressor LexA [bacterium]
MDTHYISKITSFYHAHKRMPTYSEIAALLGFRSKNAVYKLVQKLVDEGIVDKDKSGRLLPRRLESELPLLGLVKAGFPSPAEEELRDSMNLEDFLIEKKESSYLLEVDGDSMIDAHIAKGDLVIAERSEKASDGDIVIAEVDGEWTMKYFRDRGGKVWLEPANKQYKPIYPTEGLRIAAIVKGVIRKY